MNFRVVVSLLLFFCMTVTGAMATDKLTQNELEDRIKKTWESYSEAENGHIEKGLMILQNMFSRLNYENYKTTRRLSPKMAYDLPIISVFIDDSLRQSIIWDRLKFLQSRPSANYRFATTMFEMHKVFEGEIEQLGCRGHSYVEDVSKGYAVKFANKLTGAGLSGNMDDSCSGTITINANRSVMEFASGKLRSVEMLVGGGYGVKIRYSASNIRLTNERNNTYLAFVLDHQNKTAKMSEYSGPLTETEERSSLLKKNGRAVKTTNTQQGIDDDVIRAAESVPDLYPNSGATILAKLLTPVAAEQTLKQSRLDYVNSEKQTGRIAEMGNIQKHFEFSGLGTKEKFERYVKAVGAATRVWQVPYCSSGTKIDDLMPQIETVVKQYNVSDKFPALIKSDIEQQISHNDLVKNKTGNDRLCHAIKNTLSAKGLAPDAKWEAKERFGESIETFARKRAAVIAEVEYLEGELKKLKK